MKHIITILCLVLLSIAGTQNAQAQTKEETIQWLNDYGTKFEFDHLNNSCKCYFTGFDGEFIKYKVNCQFNVGRNTYSYKVLPSDILYQDVSTINENSFEYDNVSKYWFFKIKTKPEAVFYQNVDEKSNIKTEKHSYLGIEFDSKNQQKDAIRLIKAIMNLAKLSGASELPKVTENTF